MKQTTLPLISVNILTHNRRQYLAIILNKLREANYPRDKLEIIVVDNASKDGAAEMVERDFPEVRLIRRSYNSGLAGWNEGFKIARGEYIITLDDDAYPETDAYYKIVEFFQMHPKTGILSLVNYSWTDPDKIMAGLWDDSILLAFPGGTSVIRKTVLEKTGLFDERFFIVAFELDFGCRVLHCGFEITNTYQIKAFHQIKGTFRYQHSHFYYLTRNMLWITWRYLPLYAILVSNVIWLTSWFLFSLKLKAVKEFCKGLWDAFIYENHTRRLWHRRRNTNAEVTKRLLRRFNYRSLIKWLKQFFS